MAKLSVKELERQTELIGTVYAQVYLRQLSAADRDDVVQNEGIRGQVRAAYKAAVDDVGEQKAAKAAIGAARRQAESAIYVARRAGRAPSPYGDIRPILDAAGQAVRQILTDQPPPVALLTINGRPQSAPETAATIERRFRLFWESARRLSDDPLTQPAARGHLLGDGSGLEGLVAKLAPLFTREQSLLRWVALRGAIATLYTDFLAEDSTESLEELADVMGLTWTRNPDGGYSLAAKESSQQPNSDQREAAVALANLVVADYVSYYGQVPKMTISEVNADKRLASLNDVTAPDCIAWAATALLRLGRAQLFFDKVPEPDALPAPGWYTDPVLALYDRYWDGSDWTSAIRQDGREGTVSLRLGPGGVSCTRRGFSAARLRLDGRHGDEGVGVRLVFADGYASVAEARNGAEYRRFACGRRGAGRRPHDRRVAPAAAG